MLYLIPIKHPKSFKEIIKYIHLNVLYDISKHGKINIVHQMEKYINLPPKHPCLQKAYMG
jgi:hypothetical protein